MANPTHHPSPDLVSADAKVGSLSPDLAHVCSKEQPLSPEVMVSANPFAPTSSYASEVKASAPASSFASAASRPRLVPRFKPIVLPSRQYSTVDGKPSVHFTVAEFEAGVALFKHSLVAKFTLGRPTNEVIRQVFKDNWHIKGRATVSDIWDSRHLMIILDSEEDANVVLTSPLSKVGHAMFRLFRYSPDYSPKKESSTTTKWVRLPGIHPGFVTRNYVASIVNSFGFFLDLDERSKACATLKYVRACVELDVCSPIPDEVRITISDGRVFWQRIEVEGNLAYCTYCKVHGHDMSMCRKKHGTENEPKEQPSMHIQKERKSVEVTIQNSHANQKKTPYGTQEEWVQVKKKKSARKEEETIDPNLAVVVFKENDKEEGKVCMGNSIKSDGAELGPPKSILRRSDTTYPDISVKHLAKRMERLKALNGNSDDVYVKEGGSMVYCEELGTLAHSRAAAHALRGRKAMEHGAQKSEFGEGNVDSQYYLKGILNSHSVDMLVILEPKIHGGRISNIASFLGFSNFLEGADINDHIWLFWKDDIVVGPFDDLVEYSESVNCPWIIAGDFNVISNWDEKRGGNLDDDGSMDAFNQFHMDAGVSDVGFKGNPFTWSNNHRGDTRVWERLDRVICNDQAFYHCPLLIDLEDKDRKGFFFYYLKIWEDHPGFYDVVKDAWSGISHPDPIMSHGLKLKKVRVRLKTWNWAVYGCVKRKIRELKMKIQVLERRLQEGYDDVLNSDILNCKLMLDDVIRQDLCLLKENARVRWLKDGDVNSDFFHGAIKMRRVQSRVNFIVDEDSVTATSEQIGAEAVGFYSNLLTGHNPPPPTHAFGYFDRVISDDENDELTRCPTGDEILLELKCISDDSAPGPDGFTARFFVFLWDLIKADVLKGVSGFFFGLQIPKIVGGTYLTLIPKAPNPTSIADLRPISLCNVVHKLFSRLLNSRLSHVLHKLVSPEQVGFVKGRSILENIALGHDLLFDFKQKTKGGNIMIKLDMSKAYDRMSWSFILDALRASGCCEKFVDLIFRCISSPWFSIKWDGRRYGHFKSSQRLRQGDPLSPMLFVIAMEWLTKDINHVVSEGFIQGYYTGVGGRSITSLLFADDILIFSNGCKKSIENLMVIIQDFCDYSGQQLNNEKSFIFFPKKMRKARQKMLLDITKFHKGTFPVTYFGVPLYTGRTKIEYFQSLEEKVRKRISGWMKNMLSFGGKITLIDFVLNSVGIHCMSILPIPITVLNRVGSIIRSFLWDKGDGKRRHWVNWENVCREKSAGGLGIKRLEDVMLALHGKLAWTYINSDSSWAFHARRRFIHGTRGSCIWNSIDHIIVFCVRSRDGSLGKGTSLWLSFVIVLVSPNPGA
ncbi:hypothetical protein QQ045_010229 [Rhodiola kirilowii]